MSCPCLNNRIYYRSRSRSRSKNIYKRNNSAKYVLDSPKRKIYSRSKKKYVPKRKRKIYSRSKKKSRK